MDTTVLFSINHLNANKYLIIILMILFNITQSRYLSPQQTVTNFHAKYDSTDDLIYIKWQPLLSGL